MKTSVLVFVILKNRSINPLAFLAGKNLKSSSNQGRAFVCNKPFAV
jgi:hypothetical protein